MNPAISPFLPAMARSVDEKRKATNITLPPFLLQLAKENNLNISVIAEQALQQALEQLQQKQWEEKNRQFIAEYNQRIAEQGTALGTWRKF